MLMKQFETVHASVKNHATLKYRRYFKAFTDVVCQTKKNNLILNALYFCCLNVVSEVVQTLQLCADRDQSDVVGDLSVCLDGMTVDPEMFAKAEANHHSESQRSHKLNIVYIKSMQACLNSSGLSLFVISNAKNTVDTVILLHLSNLKKCQENRK